MLYLPVVFFRMIVYSLIYICLQFRVILGNLRAPYSLVVGGTSATLSITYDVASCEMDPFMTVVSGSLKNVEASFQQNPDYISDYPSYEGLGRKLD